MTWPLERSKLLAGPWLWPQEDDADGMAVACARSGVAGPSEPPPGAALLLAVTSGNPSLWKLVIGRGPASLHDVDFDATTKTYWADMAAAVSRTLPVLWSDLEPIRRAAPRAACLAFAQRETDRVVPPPETLEGKSFGVSFFLAAASLALKRGLRADVAASAAIDDAGDVHAIDAEGLKAKIELLAEAAPRVRRILVAHENVAAAREAARGRIEVVPVANGVEALREGFAEDLVTSLVAAGSDARRREELVDAFFELALSRRDAVPDWTPVRNAAEIALERWGELDEAGRARLKFAAAVAARHESNEGDFPWPGEAVLEGLPRERRVNIFAHIVQQSADHAVPPPEMTEKAALDYIGKKGDRCMAQFRLVGALGRLQAVVGRPREALLLQREEAEEIAAMGAEGLREVSFPLSAWYRLSGLLRDRSAFDDAEALYRRVSDRGDLGAGKDYVELARAGALARLGQARGADPEATLRRIADDTTRESHLRWSAARHLAAVLRREGRLADEEKIEATLREAAHWPRAGVDPSVPAPSDARTAKIYHDLLLLDRALESQDAEAASARVAAVAAAEPGLCKNLFAAADAAGADRAAHLAEAYPY